MLDVPVLAKCGYNSLFNRTMASAAYWYPHRVMAAQAVQFTADLARFCRQFAAAAFAVEMIGMEAIAAILDVCALLDDPLTLVAHIAPIAGLLLHLVALPAQRPAAVPQEANIGKLLAASLAKEALRVPARIHRLDHTPDDELTAFVAARRVQYVEVVLTVLASLKLEIDTIRERFQALRADKAVGVPDLS